MHHPMAPQQRTSSPHWSDRRGMNLIELLVVVSIIATLAALILPGIRSSSTSTYRAHCRLNLRNISLAVQSYATDYGVLPPVCTVDDQGRPLHSWRTLLLPYLDQQALYDTIDLSKPWDDPVNTPARETSLEIFRCLASNEVADTMTTYHAVSGPDACFRQGAPRDHSLLTDGTNDTAMLVDVSGDLAVPWMAPEDAGLEFLHRFDGNVTPEGLGHLGGTNVAMTDGSVRFILVGITPEERDAMISVAREDTERSR